MPRKADPDARQRILAVATRLFDAHGVHQVGMQQVIDEFGCGKNLLYREFSSKDELVVAYLTRCKDNWATTFEQARAGNEDAPARHLVALVEATAAQVLEPGFRGCSIHNTHAEFPDPDHPAHQVARAHFENMHRHLLDLAERANAPDPATLADRVLLIIEGIYSNGMALGRESAARSAPAFAAEVVRTALTPSTEPPPTNDAKPHAPTPTDKAAPTTSARACDGAQGAPPPAGTAVPSASAPDGAVSDRPDRSAADPAGSPGDAPSVGRGAGGQAERVSHRTRIEERF